MQVIFPSRLEILLLLSGFYVKKVDSRFAAQPYVTLLVYITISHESMVVLVPVIVHTVYLYKTIVSWIINGKFCLVFLWPAVYLFYLNKSSLYSITGLAPCRLLLIYNVLFLFRYIGLFPHGWGTTCIHARLFEFCIFSDYLVLLLYQYIYKSAMRRLMTIAKKMRLAIVAFIKLFILNLFLFKKQ